MTERRRKLKDKGKVWVTLTRDCSVSAAPVCRFKAGIICQGDTYVTARVSFYLLSTGNKL